LEGPNHISGDDQVSFAFMVQTNSNALKNSKKGAPISALHFAWMRVGACSF
jgi:hypothetical protein